MGEHSLVSLLERIDSMECAIDRVSIACHQTHAALTGAGTHSATYQCQECGSQWVVGDAKSSTGYSCAVCGATRYAKAVSRDGDRRDQHRV